MESNDNTTSKICELKRRILVANEKYRIGSPVISDTDYDDLVDALRSLIGESRFSEFRTELTEANGGVKHPYAMGSLEKIKAFDNTASVKKWIFDHIPENGDGSEGIFVSAKIDGCSARVSYDNGVLVGASTRGDGTFGVDLLEKAALFIPTALPKNFSGDIRGEITLTHETLEHLSDFNGKQYKNIRNATAGLINSKDASADEVSFLRFFPYEIMGFNGLSKKRQFRKLAELGFTTALHKELTDIYNEQFAGNSPCSSYDDALMVVYNGFAEIAPYDIDGLVVCDLSDDDIFENEFIPSKTVAVKFNQMTAESTLIDVEWGVSKSGKLRPVGVIEPVVLGGATVTSVTLNNISYIHDMGLTYGCKVNVLKSGDIIPKIVGVSHPNESEETAIEYPKTCPSCGRELRYDIDELYPVCVNDECDDILVNKVLHFMKQLGVKHVSFNTLKKERIYHVDDLLSLKDDGASALMRTLNKEVYSKVFGAPKESILCAFDYDGVSEKIVKKMIEHYGFDKVLSETENLLKTDLPSGVGEKFIHKFVVGRDKNIDTYRRIVGDSRYHCSLKETNTSGVLKSMGFAVTGELKSMGRNEFKNAVEGNGGHYQSSVSKRTSFLVTNDTSSGTVKIQKARSLGVKVIDEEQFLNMIQHGVEDSSFSIF